ncbi:MAG: PQQ-binding-like beta-propeller repeat protein, partial [Candidatus Bathyarchaeota archaeon]|nr:PQQ-binding-like beta-propeller repeat protein [Candidatus Bathyarchaeota archaeon]
MHLSNIKNASIALVFVLLLTLPPLVFAQTEASTSDATTNVNDLLQYEWPQIHGDSGFTRFSEGPAPEVSDILWKANVTGIESYLTAFNGKIFVTTTTNVIALDKDTGATVWNTKLPSTQRWPAVFKIDDERLVIGPYCLETETGDLLWTSEDFSAKVSYWAE